MAEPNPVYNPDTRPLPPGWVTNYDPNFKAWFYVNTQENPPRSVWEHPLGPPPPPPSQYRPPSGPPPPRRDYNQPPPYGGAYGGAPQGGWGQQGYPPQDANRGWFGGPKPQTPVQVVYQQAPSPPRKSGWGTGGMLAAGGAGLLGGVLLADVIENHDRAEYDQGYEQGFDNAGGDFDGGGDFGGGIF